MEQSTVVDPESRWLSLKEAAQLLNCTSEAVRQLVHRGTLAYRRNRPFGVGGWSRIEVPRKGVEQLLRDEEFERRRRI